MKALLEQNRIRSLAALILAAALLLCACGGVSAPAQAATPVQTAQPDPTLGPSSPPDASYGDIEISEFLVKNQASLQLSDGSFPDWIELHNVSGKDLCLSGWTLSDSKNAWSFPDVSISDGSYLLIYVDGSDCADAAGLHSCFSLSDNEVLTLYSRNGIEVFRASCGSSVEDVSFCLEPDGSYSSCLYPTPGMENTRQAYCLLQDSSVPEGPLVINEVCVENFTYLHSTTYGYCDWVEIRNISSESVLLSDYYLSDDSGDYLKWRLPGETLYPGGVALVFCIPERDGVDSTRYTNVAPFGLDSVNEQLFLSSSSRVIDGVHLRDIPYRCSYGRLDGTNGFYYISSPTPGKQNGSSGYRYVSSTPTADVPDGVYNDVDAVTVSISARGTVYYTTDGSVPSTASRIYSGPFTVSSTSIVRAVSVEPEGMASRPLTLSYLVNEYATLPVVSLVTDDAAKFQRMYRNGNKYTEITGSVSFYEDGGSFTMGCGIVMSGATSLALPKKNISVKFRGAYGDDLLDYDVFGTGITGLSALTLRSGQDYYYARVRDELAQTLCTNITDNVLTQHHRYCVLFVNGAYYGVYSLKEKLNEQYYASAMGVSKNSVEMITGSIWHGSSFVDDVWHFIKNNDMSDPEAYTQLCSVLDIDSLIDWFILESYTSNYDLYSGNVRYVRSSELDGKWRLVFYDLDCAFQNSAYGFGYLTRNRTGGSGQITAIVSRLCDNEEFCDRVISRYAELYDEFSSERLLAIIDNLVSELEPEAARDSARWGVPLKNWYTNVDRLRDRIDSGWQSFIDRTLMKTFCISEEDFSAFLADSAPNH